MGWVPDNIIEQMRGDHLLGIFIRIDTEPPLHLWMGVNDIPAGIDGVDPGGTVYLGGGRLVGVPTLEVLVNGTSDSVEFQIAGIDPKTGQAVLDSLPPVRGKAISIGLTTLDAYYQPMSSIIPIWQGTASHPGESSPAVAAKEDATLTIGLTVVSGSDTRSRASRSLWSAPHQKAISPTDRFCDGTARLARGVAPKWPQY